MPKECDICKKPAVIAARIVRGTDKTVVAFCEDCARRAGQRVRVEVLMSTAKALPQGTVLEPGNPAAAKPVSAPAPVKTNVGTAAPTAAPSGVPSSVPSARR